MCTFGIEMQEKLAEYNQRKGSSLLMRVGISCNEGSVIVFGQTRISFDIIGTVSREVKLLESSCPQNEVKVNHRIKEIYEKNDIEKITSIIESENGFVIKKESMEEEEEDVFVNTFQPHYPMKRSLSGISSISEYAESLENSDDSEIEIIESVEEIKEFSEELKRKEKLKCMEFFLQFFLNLEKQKEYWKYISFDVLFILIVLIFYLVFFISMKFLVIDIFIDLDIRQIIFHILISTGSIVLFLIFGISFFFFRKRVFLTACIYVILLLFVVFILNTFLMIDFKIYIVFRTAVNISIALIFLFVPIFPSYVKLVFYFIYAILFRIFYQVFYENELKNFMEYNKNSNSYTVLTEVALYIGVFLFASFGFFQKYVMMKDFRRYRIAQRRFEKVREKEELNRILLMSVLPEMVIERIKKGEANFYELHECSVGFLEICHFDYLFNHNPERIVELTSTFFSYIDYLIHEFSIEKIKSINQLYLFYSTRPERSKIDCLLFSIHLMKQSLCFDSVLRKHRFDPGNHSFKDNPSFQIKIGICCGECHFGIIGQTKFLYDVFGNSVNLASRLTSTCENGEIQVCKRVVNGVVSIIPSFGNFLKRKGFVKMKGYENEIPTFKVEVDRIENDQMFQIRDNIEELHEREENN